MGDAVNGMESSHHSKGNRKQMTAKKEKEWSGNMKQHFPWLVTFDNEAKMRLIAPEVTNADVLKLITILESNVSPEVSKLMTKPNRATKFLTQVRRRISMVKMSGFMIERDREMELFPTYGLLMTHIVNITLNSSTVKKYGALKVAQDLYYFLKLMFQEDKEYVLDVVLCSILDEHSASQHKVGFQLFSSIVEDWKCYFDTHSSQMKYCAIASILSEAGSEGEAFIESNIPDNFDSDKAFPKFLNRKLHIEVGGILKKKTQLLKWKTLISAIKVTRVKQISRNKLIVVSKKSISARSAPEGSTEEDSDSSATIDVDLPTTSCYTTDQPTSSSAIKRHSQAEKREDPLNDFLEEIGIDIGGGGMGFTLDCVGDQSTNGNEEYNYNYNREDFEGDVGAQDESIVSSSTAYRQRFGQFVNDAVVKTETEVKNSDDDEASDLLPCSFDILASTNKNLRKEKLKKNLGKSVSFEMDQGIKGKEPTPGQSHLCDIPTENSRAALNASDISDNDNQKKVAGYTICSDDEQEQTEGFDAVDFDNKNVSISNEQKTIESKETSESGNQGFSPIEMEQTEEATLKDRTKEVPNDLGQDSDSSELEILSIRDNETDEAGDSGESESRSKDEADPESGEDYVPNYQEDSDDDDDECEKNSNTQQVRKEGSFSMGEGLNSAATECGSILNENPAESMGDDERNLQSKETGESFNATTPVSPKPFCELKPQDVGRNNSETRTTPKKLSKEESDPNPIEIEPPSPKRRKQDVEDQGKSSEENGSKLPSQSFQASTSAELSPSPAQTTRSPRTSVTKVERKSNNGRKSVRNTVAIPKKESGASAVTRKRTASTRTDSETSTGTIEITPARRSLRVAAAIANSEKASNRPSGFSSKVAKGSRRTSTSSGEIKTPTRNQTGRFDGRKSSSRK